MDQAPANDLVIRIRSGDREAAARYLLDNSNLLRRRVRGRLSPGLRAIFGSEDIVSTVGRRLDEYVRRGLPEIESERDLFALVMRMALNAIVDKERMISRLRRVERGEEVFARQMLRHLQGADPQACAMRFESAVERALQAQGGDTDRKILWMWLMDWRLKDIGAALAMNPPAVRERWKRIKERLRPLLESAR